MRQRLQTPRTLPVFVALISALCVSMALGQSDSNFGFSTGSVAAFGDWNSDKFVDAFVTTMSGTNTTITVFLWSQKKDEFLPLSTQITVQQELLSVTPGDFNHDGRMDLLISTVKTPTIVSMTVYFGDYKTISSSLDVANDAGDQVLVFDANNDLIPDLFGPDPNGIPSVWMNDGTGKFTIQAFPALTGKTLSKPHSNAFIDMNGDCLADLVVTTIDGGVKTVNILQNTFQPKPGISYTLKATVSLPESAGQISFADFDRDSSVDFVFPVIDTSSIVVVYNNPSQKMCSSVTGTGSNCYSPTNLCNVDFLSFASSVPPITNCTGPRVSVIPLPVNTTFTDSAAFPATLRVGDYNIDGLPDLVFPVTVDTEGTLESVAAIYQNKRSSDSCGITFQALKTLSFTDVYAATWLDIKESGDLDVIVLSSTNGTSSIGTYTNNYLHDTGENHENFFLKVLGLNGVCAQWCDSGPKFPDPRPMGVNTPGGTWKFTITDLKGSKVPVVQPQLNQNAYLALQTPYAIAGLEQVSNYIDTLFYGITTSSDQQCYNSWPGVIPNAQVAAFPYPEDKPIKWLLIMYVIPSNITIWVVTACIACCVCLAAGILYLMYKERQADKRELLDRPFRFTM